MQECSYGLNICFPNSLLSPYKHGMVDDLITDHKKSKVGTNALGLQFQGGKNAIFQTYNKASVWYSDIMSMNFRSHEYVNIFSSDQFNV